MNRKRKLLTVAALVAFGVIMTLHYTTHFGNLHFGYTLPLYNQYMNAWEWSYGRPIIEYVQTPLFALAVLYTGLFFILGESTTPTKPK